MLNGHTATVASVAFHPGGRWLASGSADGTVRLWGVGALKEPTDAPPGQVVDLHGGPVRDVAFSPDGDLLAAACTDSAVRLLPVSATDGAITLRGSADKIRLCKGHTAAVTCLAFAPDGKRLASGSMDKTVRFWDVATAQLATMWVWRSQVTALAFDLWGRVGFGNAEDFCIVFRSPGEDIFHGQGSHAAPVLSLCFDRQRRTFTGAGDGTLKLWPLGVNVAELAVAQDRFPALRRLGLSPDERWVAAGYADGKVRLWELAEPAQRDLVGGTQSAVFVGERPLLVCGGHAVDYTRGLPGTILPFTRFPVDAIAIHPDGGRFAFCDGGRDVRVWDHRRRAELARWDAHDLPVTALAGSPDGKLLATASRAGDIKLWSWDTRTLQRTFAPGVGPVAHLAWSRDGAHLAATGKAGGVVWRLDGPPHRGGRCTPRSCRTAVSP